MNYGETSEEPLLKYSEDCERASYLDDYDTDEEDYHHHKKNNSMPKKRRIRKGKNRSGKKFKSKTKGIKLTKGKVSIRLAGLGVQRLGSSDLIKFVSLGKLKEAARKFLQSKGIVKKRRKGRKKRE